MRISIIYRADILRALQWHYRILQAMALDEDIPDKPDDKTIPKYRQIDKVARLLKPAATLFPLWKGGADSVTACGFLCSRLGH